MGKLRSLNYLNEILFQSASQPTTQQLNYPFLRAGFDFMVKVALDDTEPGLPALFWNSPFWAAFKNGLFFDAFAMMDCVGLLKVSKIYKRVNK
ncbi:hypothetical protein BDD43_5744 [Mucilaginibacter gracilis]|uniref:Uncharacterized protein n=1 Tax=Mucilaginibacter gracilis TaxID=423350 RepID=A0A495J9K1_9SPHI|nr:hypothetical protein BDD43_5744 [Mucilaginibacter gracilis]